MCRRCVRGPESIENPTMKSIDPIEKLKINLRSFGNGLSRNRKLNRKQTPLPARQTRKPKKRSHRDRDKKASSSLDRSDE